MDKHTKNADEENFPVGSFLIPAPLRPHVAVFYEFARTADDIADSPTLTSAQKLRRLNALENVLTERENVSEETLCAEKLQLSLKQIGLSDVHARDLLKAFRQDAVGKTYETFDELIAYCRYSAASVGRFMLDLHGENPSAYFSSDALCAALQINNHLQDCREDFQKLGRVYLPLNWFKEQGIGYDALNDAVTSPKLRAVFDRTVDAVEGLLTESAPLPLVIASRGLRAEICVIHKLAQKLADRLKKNDILAKKVELKKIDWLTAGVSGIFNGLRRKKIK